MFRRLSRSQRRFVATAAIAVFCLSGFSCSSAAPAVANSFRVIASGAIPETEVGAPVGRRVYLVKSEPDLEHLLRVYGVTRVSERVAFEPGAVILLATKPLKGSPKPFSIVPSSVAVANRRLTVTAGIRSWRRGKRVRGAYTLLQVSLPDIDSVDWTDPDGALLARSEPTQY